MPNDARSIVIAIDAHISTCDLAAVDAEGHLSYTNRIATSAQSLIAEIKQIPGQKVIVVEEGPLASWLIRTLRPYSEKVVSSDPKRNRWIAQDAYKNDPLDATKLAQLYRGGFIKEIYHPEEAHREAFKQAVLFYHDLVKHRTRLKNQLKARFRAHGIRCQGQTLFNPERQAKWLERLKDSPQLQWQVTLLLEQLAVVSEHQEAARAHLEKMSCRYPEIRRLMKLPGFGPVHAATVHALVDTPHRFPTKQKVWTYFGLGLTQHSSGGKSCPRHLNQACNRLLKSTIKQAVESALRSHHNRFKAQYEELVFKKGKLPHRAKLTVARSMVSTLWAMWKKGTAYVEG